VFELGIGDDLGISYKWYGFAVSRLKVKVRVTCIVRPLESRETLRIQETFSNVG